jgi:2',3'-cyclic-nucleotide 2'-phosphodiesterase (5'-nucleotidase family)
MSRNARTLLRTLVAVVAVAGILIAPAGPAAAEGPVDFWLTILHNNDAESRLIAAGDGELANYGGAARFATQVELLKAEGRLGWDPTACLIPRARIIQALVGRPGNPLQRMVSCGPAIPDTTNRGVVMVSSGDNFLAGPQFAASLAKGPPFYDAIAMEMIGYDAAVIGNHEFDFGPDVFADFVESFNEAPEDAQDPGPPPFISANLDFSAEPRLQALVERGRIAASTVVEEGGQLIGIVGATTPMLPHISSPRRVVVQANVAAAAQAEIDRLRNAGINKIIFASHLQSVEEDLELIPLLRGVDVAIAGGGDEVLANPGTLLVPGDEIQGPYPTTATDADGRSVPVITTAGDYKYVGRLVVGFDAAGEVVAIDSAKSGPVRVSGVAPDGVPPHPGVQRLVVEPVAAYVAALRANVIGHSEVALEGRRAPGVRSTETNLGNLLADALRWQANRLADTFGVAPAHIALQNGGGIRNNSLIPAGPITELTTFDIAPFSNFVSIVHGVSAAQLKEILENAVSRIELADGRFAQISGFRFTYDPAGTAQLLDDDLNVTRAGTRVRDVVLDDGTVLVQNGAVVAGAPAVNVATIDFLARGGDQYPFRGLPFATVGVTYQQALSNYIRHPEGLGGVITAARYPEGGSGRITP